MGFLWFKLVILNPIVHITIILRYTRLLSCLETGEQRNGEECGKRNGIVGDKKVPTGEIQFLENIRFAGFATPIKYW